MHLLVVVALELRVLLRLLIVLLLLLLVLLVLLLLQALLYLLLHGVDAREEGVAAAVRPLERYALEARHRVFEHGLPLV